MKLTLNKACDLNSISVLPPQARRGNAVQMGSESSIFAKSQASSSRFGNSIVPPAMSQSQQSFSQGLPLSQLSQSSLDELTVTNEQRLGSQDRENSVKRAPSLAPGYGLEEGQLQLRSSTNMLRRWNPPTASDNRFSEELERRLGMMDTTLHRLGMILDSVQGDVMQINKAVKEVCLEVEVVRQKMMAQDNALQLVLKEEEAIKASIDGTMKSIPDELRKEANQPKLQEIVTKLTSMPDFIEARFYKLKAELCCAFTQEIQAIKEKKEMQCSKEPPLLNDRSVLPAKNVAYTNASGRRRQHLLQQGSGELHGSLTNAATKNLNSSRVETWTKKVKEEEQPSAPGSEKGKWNIIIDSDDDLETEFPSMFRGDGNGRYSVEEADEEAQRILRRARRRKRKHESKDWHERVILL
ncbi:putative recombination initiation defects 3 [Nymphaea colorata]|nr:putative recombination initiation defects 3 [Nymphaea colorata]